METKYLKGIFTFLHIHISNFFIFWFIMPKPTISDPWELRQPTGGGASICGGIGLLIVLGTKHGILK